MGLRAARDLPNDFTYGVGSDLDPQHRMADVVKNQYAAAADCKTSHIDRVADEYRPQYRNNVLKPPKPTRSSMLKLKRLNDFQIEQAKKKTADAQTHLGGLHRA